MSKQSEFKNSLRSFFIDYSPANSPCSSPLPLEEEGGTHEAAVECLHPPEKAFEVDYMLTCTVCGFVLDSNRIVDTLEGNGLWGQVSSFIRRVANRSHRKELFEKKLTEVLGLEAKVIPESLLDELKAYMSTMNVSPKNKCFLAIIKHHLKETKKKAYYDHLFKIAGMLGGHIILIDGVSMETLRNKFLAVEAVCKKRKDLHISRMEYVVCKLLTLTFQVETHYNLVISDDTRRKYDHRWSEIVRLI